MTESKRVVLKDSNGVYLIPFAGIPNQTGQSGKVLGTDGTNLTFVAKQDVISDLSTIRSGASAGATALQSGDNVSELINNSGYITSSAVGTATLTIQKNGTAVDTFSANATTDKIINIVVPTSASDISALSSSTKYGASLSLSINSSTYVVTAQLKDQDGNNLGTAQTIDLPLESVVVNGSYDSTNEKIVLTLQSGSTIDIPVGDLIAGLQSEITSSNMLDADLVDDSTSTNKFVTASDKSTWSGKQDAISDLSSIRTNATNGASAYTTIQGYGDIVTHDASEFATSTQGGKADTALQSGDNISELNNNSGYITGITGSDVTTALGFTPYNSTNPNGYQANVIESIKVNNVAQTITSKSVNITVPTTTSSVTSGSTAALTSGGAYTALSDKQDTLVSGTNIKTINNTSLLGDGNITIESGSNYTAGTGIDITNGVISVDSKVTTEIELATVATTGAYSDLTGTPTIPTVNNATLTIQKNGTNITTFTANASSDVTANIVVPTITDTYSATSSEGMSGKAVASAISGKQDTLVSGTNIKTINNTSILGSGNIALPTVNNASLIIQKNGTNVATFTANASSNVTANISVPNTVSSVSSSSTNADAVGAKLFYDTVGAIDDALSAIISGTVMRTLTFNLTGSYKSYLSSLTVNGTTYTYSDFTNNSLALSFPQGTSITWSATTTGVTSASPSSGSLTLNSDSIVSISIDYTGGGGTD